MRLLFFTFLIGAIHINAQVKYEIPTLPEREDFFDRGMYAFSYNEAYELSSFVAYQLNKSMAETYTENEGKLKEDEAILTGTANKKDYKNTGYVAGQLIPSGEFVLDENSSEQLLLATNIAPMKPAFYGMNWNEINRLIRAWCIQSNSTLYITAGPVLNDAPFSTIGDNKVSVPTRYYKVVLDLENKKAIGFIFKNGFVQNNLSFFAMSVDDIEKETGLDYFPLLDDTMENMLEKNFNKEQWDWQAIEKIYGE